MRIAVCLLAALLTTTVAVDRSKFKTCDQASFCKRNREAASRITNGDSAISGFSGYRIDGPLSVDGKSTVRGTIRNNPNVPLYFELSAYEDGIARMRVYEKHPKRYMGPTDALIALKLATLTSQGEENGVSRFAFGEKGEIRISHDPFRVEVLHDGQPIILGNNRGFFNFEHMRSKESDDGCVPKEIPQAGAARPDTWDEEQDGKWEPPMEPNPACSGRWDESFGSHPDSKPLGPTSVGIDFSFVNSAHVYGIPEHATSLALKPTRGNGITSDPYRLYNLDVFEYELDNPMALYGSVPLMISHTPAKTSAVFWLNSAEMWIDVAEGGSAAQPQTDTHWISESGILDVFFLVGPKPADVFRQYASLTGSTSLPPMFSLGYHQCKWNYKSQVEVAEVDAGFDNADIPYDVIWLDIEHTDGKKYFTWDRGYFPEPAQMQKELAGKGRKLVTIVDPHIKRDSGYYVHQEAQNQKMYVRDKNNNEYEGSCWPGQSSWVDFLDPRGRDFWASQFAYDKYQQSSEHLFIWNDMNEPSVFSGPEVTMHKDALHVGDVEHREVHNAYGFYQHLATTEGLVKRNSGQNVRPFVLTRAFFAGSQRYSAVWTGDNAAKWDHLEIAQPMLLSLGLAGIAFSGADVGGFFNNPDAELLTRWYQAGAFHPFFRGHGHLETKRKEPFLFEEPYKSAMRDAIALRYSFLPYWYTLFAENVRNGAPPMRPLWVHYPSDTSVFAEQDEYLVGSDLLVKPVVASGVTRSRVYFPGDEAWYDFVAGGRSYAGGSAVEINAPISKILVFQRGGSIVPRKERLRRSSTQMQNDPYTLQIALDSRGEARGELYIDDERTFDHTRGVFLRRAFQFADRRLTSSAIGSNTFPAVNRVERVVVFNVQQQPSKVTLESNGETRALQFVYEPSVRKLTIRKPDVAITDDWSIVIA
eukprot:TRINITY_DN8582_c0_g1_i1.p1 TRINITY_DN8582_c0_g1~~TRINITY_DN8582_c0_g1_i1.p1  ORF type:complete len:926 (-),score=425.77 TRINITY_DN8582_c0_g1_i1:222-2999(-)